MKALPILLFLMLQIVNYNDGNVRKELNLSLEQLYGIARVNSFATREVGFQVWKLHVGLSGIELLMIGLCFVLAVIYRKRRSMNENIRKRIKILQMDYSRGSNIPQIISSTLEDCVMDINDLRVKVELASLKKFITSEVSAIKMVQDYYKDIIDDAVEEVDRVISAEGL